MSYVSASPGCSQAGGLVTCLLGTMNAPSAQGVLITVSPAAPGTIGNTVYVASDIVNPAAVTATTTVTIVAEATPVPGLSPWGMAGTALALLAASALGSGRKRCREQ